MKQLPQNYRTAPTADLIVLEINHRIQMAEHNSMADLIKRELKRRKKLERVNDNNLPS